MSAGIVGYTIKYCIKLYKILKLCIHEHNVTTEIILNTYTSPESAIMVQYS